MSMSVKLRSRIQWFVCCIVFMFAVSACVASQDGDDVQLNGEQVGSGDTAGDDGAASGDTANDDTGSGDTANDGQVGSGDTAGDDGAASGDTANDGAGDDGQAGDPEEVDQTEQTEQTATTIAGDELVDDELIEDGERQNDTQNDTQNQNADNRNVNRSEPIKWAKCANTPTLDNYFGQLEAALADSGLGGLLEKEALAEQARELVERDMEGLLDEEEMQEFIDDLVNEMLQDSEMQDIMDSSMEDVLAEIEDEVHSQIKCGVVSVPLDYHDASSGSLNIAVTVIRATNPENRIGYLLVNPGGPGQSGIEMVHTAAIARYNNSSPPDSDGFISDDLFAESDSLSPFEAAVFTDEVFERFDIIGFDPRGVSQSGPNFDCGGVAERQKILGKVEFPYDTAEEKAAGARAVQVCMKNMGSAQAGGLHTGFVARDMDEIRKALGAEQISYYGASYGSTVGVWYATLFPAHVRAMVIDGADNPIDEADSMEERIYNTIEEIAPIERALRNALEACDNAATCPIYNNGNPVGYFTANSGKLQRVSDALDGHPAAGALAVITTLYAESLWPLLWNGLSDLVENDNPAPLAQLAKLQIGEKGNGVATFTEHVNCLDSWILQSDMDSDMRIAQWILEVDALKTKLRLLSHLDIAFISICPFYDAYSLPALERPFNGSDVQILVIGNLSDPVTPYSESKELVDEVLSNGYLLEVQHETHTVYPDNACVNDAVHAVLIDLVDLKTESGANVKLNCLDS